MRCFHRYVLFDDTIACMNDAIEPGFYCDDHRVEVRSSLLDLRSLQAKRAKKAKGVMIARAMRKKRFQQ